jgi:hypothetical protein
VERLKKRDDERLGELVAAREAKEKAEKAALDARQSFELVEQGYNKQRKEDQAEIARLKGDLDRLASEEGSARQELARIDLAVRGNLLFVVVVLLLFLLCHNLFHPFAGFYPSVGVEAARTQLARLGVEPTDAALAGNPTSVVDRVEQLGTDATALSYAARRLCRYVWPGQGTPIVLAELARHLGLAPGGVESLQESASRAGSLWTVCLLKSWYPDADLELLKEGFRDDDTYEALKERPDLRDAACTIADFVDLSEFIPDRVPPAKDSEDDYADVEEPAGDPKGKATVDPGCSKTDDVASSSKAAE